MTLKLTTTPIDGNLVSQEKETYLKSCTAALDGMWLTGFIPQAQHYQIMIDAKSRGYFVVNDENMLLQFHFIAENECLRSEAFSSIISADNLDLPSIKGAFTSTAEPHFLSLCLDHFSETKVHTLMYQMESPSSETVNLTPISEMQTDEAVAFVLNNLPMPEGWLRGYFANLIARGELFGYWQENKLLGTGECRGYDKYQTEYADLGMIVDKSIRGQGIATRILTALNAVANSKGLTAICSTEKENIAAQRAISKAGFIAKHRILKFNN